jgi:hypothetical protein
VPTAGLHGIQVAANIAWGAGALRLCQASTLNHVDNALTDLLAHPECRPQTVSNIAYAMARVRMVDSKGFPQIVDWAVPRLPSFGDQEAFNLLWACAVLNKHHSQLLVRVWPRAAALSQQLRLNILEARAEGSRLGVSSDDRRM